MSGHRAIAAHWRELFGTTVRRVSLDAGLGCPNRAAGGCAYCDPASFAQSAGDGRSVAEQLGEGIARGRARGERKFAAYFQPGTNTAAPLHVLKDLWGQAAGFPEVVALCVGTRPDCVPDEVLALLASHLPDFGEIWLELGLQSAHDATLMRIGRGHTAAHFADAARRAARLGVKVCAHVILGLPGETEEMERETARFIAALPVEGVKLHQLAVVRGTRLEEEYARGEVGLLTEDEYVFRASEFIGELPSSVILHRLAGDTLRGREIGPGFKKDRVVEGIRLLLSRSKVF